MADELEGIQIETNLVEERKQMIAHQMWEDEGRPEGQAERHWNQACLVMMTLADEQEFANPAWLQAQDQNYVAKPVIEVQAPAAETNFTPSRLIDSHSALASLEELKNRVLKRTAA